jgi:folate-dependent phosphoribosylglycinamide formyltransferase PurN
MTDISEAERLALIAREQVALVLEEAENAELEARAFSQDRARQRRPYDVHVCSVIPFHRTTFGKR